VIAALMISYVLHPHNILGGVIVCCLFNTLLYPGDIHVLVIMGALDDLGTRADVVGKMRHVKATMTYH
jgi:hypothetical protein